MRCQAMLHGGRQVAGGAVIEEAMHRQATLGTAEFYVSPVEMLGVLKRTLCELPRPVLSLNRPHAGGRSVIHRVEWRGLVFTCVSHRPLAIG
jgi:hypothetical protein